LAVLLPANAAFVLMPNASAREPAIKIREIIFRCSCIVFDCLLPVLEAMI
jgi:hypothetical protein